jgi:hypothetical protein
MPARQDRINLALSQLVEHTVPAHADEAANDQRLDEAWAHAHDIINAYVAVSRVFCVN